MTKTVIGGIIVGAIVVGASLFPAIKGPYNRFKNNMNEKLNTEYVVDNYKAEYVKLYEQRAEISKSLAQFDVEKKVASKKLSYAKQKMETAKATLKNVGAKDLKGFTRAKDAYELAKTEVDNLGVMIKTYAQAVIKLEKSLALIEANMAKAKLNVDTLASKKTMVDTIRNVNKSIENLNGVGDGHLSINIEKLDDDLLRESIKLESLDKSDAAKPVTTAEAEAYLSTLK